MPEKINQKYHIFFGSMQLSAKLREVLQWVVNDEATSHRWDEYAERAQRCQRASRWEENWSEGDGVPLVSPGSAWGNRKPACRQLILHRCWPVDGLRVLCD